MSFPPKPPARLLLKKSQCSSRERMGTFSIPGPLRTAPMLTGVPHGASILVRCDTRMSKLPSPPGRSEAKYSVSPLFDWAGPASLYGELIAEPVQSKRQIAALMLAALEVSPTRSSE